MTVSSNFSLSDIRSKNRLTLTEIDSIMRDYETHRLSGNVNNQLTTRTRTDYNMNSYG